MYDANHLMTRLAGAGGRDRVFASRPGLEEMSYGTLFDGAGRIATVLAAAGLRPGDRVAAQVGKSLEAVQLYLGTVMAGGVFLPLNSAYTASEVAYFLADATPRVVVCDPGQADAIVPLAPEARVLTLAADGEGSLTDAAAGLPPMEEAVPRGANDLAAILYTSGTTGRSKGAMLSHENLASNSLVLRDLWRFTPDDVLIHALPIFHTHGLFVATNVALLSGCALHFLPHFDADAIIDALPFSTVLMGVPTFYTRLLDHPGLTREAAGNMRLFISGSAPLLVDTHEKWQARTGHRILERYGMTETNMNTSNPYEGERRPGTVGLPLPGVDLRVMDAGLEVKRGEIGVIEVRGPNVFRGYWNMPGKTAEELRPDGWFKTGDQGVVDADGYVTIVGREKDMVITGGFNVYPKEVETVIDSVPGVHESAVIGVPHPDLGEAVVAIVVADSPTVKEGDVAAALTGDLAGFKRPKRIVMCSDLPRNTMGKVQKKALRDDHAGLFES
ncbi:malonyl-CoA synthase [Roseovarius sp. TE539]|uniref:malonate--CoA ligase n=1 Tax=Roseovarius sp. TE539 TaxID=2249812 RepID=UPI000DDEE4E5|nr:malonyl-CoA synthase [Roseovarius sp. TE539]RBI77543.1 malonyl-CoA synthase [Roseovarius sp. TE539]